MIVSRPCLCVCCLIVAAATVEGADDVRIRRVHRPEGAIYEVVVIPSREARTEEFCLMLEVHGEIAAYALVE